MKVSRNWLQTYFIDPLPPSSELVDALTFHSCEVEEVVEGDDDVLLDVKVLPDRAPYLLSHRGIALELSAALNRPLAKDPLREPLPTTPATSELLAVHIEDPELCPRYMATLIENVAVGPSPDWLRTALESVGQRSINTIVDATNYVMLNMGQPLHAFDADKLGVDPDGVCAIAVRGAREGESITALGGVEYTLPAGTPVIADKVSGNLLGIAGVKGGVAAEVTADTTRVAIEAANFSPVLVRRTSQTLKLWTDASQRFQNNVSAELVAYGMRDVCALILDIAGGTVAGAIDTLTAAPVKNKVRVTAEGINAVLGSAYTLSEIQDALGRLQLPAEQDGDALTVTPSFERFDIATTQDVAEEVGRILGYERISPIALPAPAVPPRHAAYRGIERIKDALIERGFTEISTQAFAADGDIMLANPLQMDRPALRTSLSQNMRDTLTRSVREAPLVLGPDPSLQLFELGNVFTAQGEYLSLCLGYRPVSGKPTAVLADCLDHLTTVFGKYGLTQGAVDGDVVELSLRDVALEQLGQGYTPMATRLSTYHPFSLYPFATRDIAVWVPEGTPSSAVSLLIAKSAGDLLARMDLFDRFDKEGRTSYAFRLVFQSHERTLSDADLDPTMQAVSKSLGEQVGWEVR